jgi:integrase
VVAPQTFEYVSDANAWLSVIETDIVRGTLLTPAQRAAEASGGLGVADVAEEWLAAKRGQRATTLAADRAALAYALPILGELRIDEVTVADVRKVVEAMTKRGIAPATIKRHVGVISALFKHAEDCEYIDRSPVRRARLGMPERQVRERPMLTPAELLRLADEIEPRYRALVLVGGALGLRWSEAIGLRIRDLNLADGTVTVAQTVQEVAGKVSIVAATKSASSRRTLTVPRFLLDVLEAHIAEFRPGAGPDALIFTGSNGATLRRSFTARKLRPAVARAGLPEALNFHGLRHVASSLLVANGEHPRVVQQRLGHADPVLSMGLYAHTTDEADRRAADHLDAAFRAD